MKNGRDPPPSLLDLRDVQGLRYGSSWPSYKSTDEAPPGAFPHLRLHPWSPARKTTLEARHSPNHSNKHHSRSASLVHISQPKLLLLIAIIGIPRTTCLSHTVHNPRKSIA